MNRFDIIKTVLCKINPRDLDFHAYRYTSAKKLQKLIEDLKADDYPHKDPDYLENDVEEIAESCKVDDGGEWGHIPCLGGQPWDIWCAVLHWIHTGEDKDVAPYL